MKIGNDTYLYYTSTETNLQGDKLLINIQTLPIKLMEET